MEYIIKDFVDRPCVAVRGQDYAGVTGLHKLVMVVANSGSLTFQGNFTTTQARELAQALIDCADTLELVEERQRETAQEVMEAVGEAE